MADKACADFELAQLAVAAGDEAALQRLLEEGSEGSEIPPGTRAAVKEALLRAAAQGRATVVCLAGQALQRCGSALSAVRVEREAHSTVDVLKGKAGWRPLALAFGSGSEDTVLACLEAGCDGREPLDFGQRQTPPMVEAASLGMLRAVQALLDLDVPPDCARANGWTALMSAAKHGHVEVMRALLAAGADANACVAHTEDAAILAAIRGAAPEATLKILLTAGAIPEVPVAGGRSAHGGLRAASKPRTTPLLLAVEQGSATMVQALIDAGADPTRCRPDGWSPLHAAAQRGDRACAQALVAAGASPAQAARDGRLPFEEVARLHLRACDGEGREVQSEAAAGWQEALGREEELVEAEPVHQPVCTPPPSTADTLQLADMLWPASLPPSSMHRLMVVLCLAGHGSFVSRALRDGFPVGTAFTKHKWTLLHLACQAGFPHVVRLLLEGEADPTALSDGQMTPLHVAARSGAASCLKQVLEAACSRQSLIANACDLQGMSMLMYAARAGCSNCIHVACDVFEGAGRSVAELVDQQVVLAPTRSYDLIGRTALHIAALHGHWDACQALLSKGAAADVWDERGCLPLQLAVEGNHSQVLEGLLRVHGPGSANLQHRYTEDSLLVTAIKHKALTCVEVLLQAGAVPMPDGDEPRESALHVAARTSCSGPSPTAMLQLVLDAIPVDQHKRAVLHRNYEGLTSLDVAAERLLTAHVRMLLQYAGQLPEEVAGRALSKLIISTNSAASMPRTAPRCPATFLEAICEGAPPPRQWQSQPGPPNETCVDPKKPLVKLLSNLGAAGHLGASAQDAASGLLRGEIRGLPRHCLPELLSHVWSLQFWSARDLLSIVSNKVSKFGFGVIDGGLLLALQVWQLPLPHGCLRVGLVLFREQAKRRA